MKLIILCALFCNCCGQMILNSDKCMVDGNLFNELLSTKCALKMMTKEMNETKVQMEDKLQEGNRKIEQLQRKVQQCERKVTEAESKHLQLSKNLENSKKDLETMKSQVEYLLKDLECIESIGPAGTSVGNTFSDKHLHYNGRVSKIFIRSGTDVDCLP